MFLNVIVQYIYTIMYASMIETHMLILHPSWTLEELNIKENSLDLYSTCQPWWKGRLGVVHHSL